MSKHDEEITDLEQRVERLESDVEQLESNQIKSNKKFSKLQDQNTALEREIAEIKLKLSRLK